MATKSTTGSGAASQVYGGTVVNGGSATGPVSNVIALKDLKTADDSVVENMGSRVLANDGTGASTTDRVGVAKAVSGGTLAFNASATQWVVRGINATTIGGVANTTLQSPGSHYDSHDDRTQLHYKNVERDLGSRVIDVLAAPSTEIQPAVTITSDGDRITFIDPAQAGGATASADLGKPTRAVPGELTYHFGALGKPTTDEYKASNVRES